MSMGLGRGLAPEEQEKFDRIQQRFPEFLPGFGHIVCESTGHGEDRTLNFVEGFVGPPLASLSAARFLATSDEELLRELSGQLSFRPIR